MNWVLAIEQLLRLASLAWVDLRRAPLPALLGLWLLLQLVVMVIAADPTHPMWASWVVPFFRWRFGELYLHYPQALIGLATSSDTLRLPMQLFVGSWVHLAISAAVLQALRHRRIDDNLVLRQSVAAWPRWLLASVLLQLLWFGLYTWPVSGLLDGPQLPYRVRLLIGYGGALLPLLASLPFLYLAPALVDGMGLRRGLRASWKRLSRSKTTSFLLVSLPWVVGLPFDWVLDRATLLANQLRPEFVLLVVLLRATVVLLATFIVWDGAARLHAGADPGQGGGR